MDCIPCPKVDELIATPSKMSESTISSCKKNMTECCLYCGERLDPTGIVFSIVFFSAYMWCQNCDKKNFFGKIRQNLLPLPSPPVIKRLGGYQLRQRKMPVFQQPSFFDSSISNNENSISNESSSSSSENQECMSSSNRLTLEEISRLMCAEALAKKQKREELRNEKNP